MRIIKVDQRPRLFRKNTRCGMRWFIEHDGVRIATGRHGDESLEKLVVLARRWGITEKLRINWADLQKALKS